MDIKTLSRKVYEPAPITDDELAQAAVKAMAALPMKALGCEGLTIGADRVPLHEYLIEKLGENVDFSEDDTLTEFLRKEGAALANRLYDHDSVLIFLAKSNVGFTLEKKGGGIT